MGTLKNIAFLIFYLLITKSYSQSYEYVYRDASDHSINCYLKVIPNTESITGLIVRDFSSLPDTSKTSPFQFLDLSLKQGFATIYAVTSKRFPELYYFDKEPALLDEIIAEVVRAHDIPKENIFIGGISASGARATRFAQYCAQNKSRFETKIKGVFVVDSPLDLERFYYSARDNQGNFKDGMLSESYLIMEKFPEYIGHPHDQAHQYIQSSIHSYRNPTKSPLKSLKDTPIIFFHEPDIDWWLEERGASYYDINSFDIANAVAFLRELGNDRVELITTTEKGFDRKGNRKCHSWTIVDEPYLVDWILKHTEKDE